MKMITCPYCGASTFDKYDNCPYCHKQLRKPTMSVEQKYAAKQERNAKLQFAGTFICAGVIFVILACIWIMIFL